MSALISKTIAEGAQGVVVTQGTDTIEESAFYLDVLHQTSAPIVVTGAMRNPTMVGADGPANLLAAIEVAASPSAMNLGCLVVMNDEVHAARQVQKTHANSTAAFRSPETGPVGRIVEDRFILNSTPVGRVSLRMDPPADRLPVVKLYVAMLGDDGSELDSIPLLAQGLVVAGFGGGHVHPDAVERLERVAEKIPVILTSRTGAGVALRSTYDFPGSEYDLLARGLINGGSLDPLKARILLTLLLSANATRDAITEAYDSSTPQLSNLVVNSPTNELTITWRGGTIYGN